MEEPERKRRELDEGKGSIRGLERLSDCLREHWAVLRLAALGARTRRRTGRCGWPVAGFGGYWAR
jgi:hypothetical protein